MNRRNLLRSAAALALVPVGKAEHDSPSLERIIEVAKENPDSLGVWVGLSRDGFAKLVSLSERGKRGSFLTLFEDDDEVWIFDEMLKSHCFFSSREYVVDAIADQSKPYHEGWVPYFDHSVPDGQQARINPNWLRAKWMMVAIWRHKKNPPSFILERTVPHDPSAVWTPISIP